MNPLGKGPLVEDTLHFLTNAMNNNSVSFRFTGREVRLPSGWLNRGECGCSSALCRGVVGWAEAGEGVEVVGEVGLVVVAAGEG